MLGSFAEYEKDHIKNVIERNKDKSEIELRKHLQNRYWKPYEIEYGIKYWGKVRKL